MHLKLSFTVWFNNFTNINNGANLRLSLVTQYIQNGDHLQAPDRHRELCPLDPSWWRRPQIPVIGSRSALAMGSEPCAVLNSRLKVTYGSSL